MTFSARYLASVIQFAAQQGADESVLFNSSGLSWEMLQDMELRVEADIYNRVVEQAVAMTSDDFFGLHMGEFLSLSAAGIIGQITQTSSNVKEALDYMVAFANLGCQALPVTLVEEKESWAIQYSPSADWVQQSPIAARHTLEGVMAFTLREFHTLTLQKHFPKAIHFAYPRPADFKAYERVFQCPIHFNGSASSAGQVSSISLHKKHVQEKIMTNDYELLRLLVQHAEKKLISIQSEKGFFKVVRQSIVNMIKPQFPSIGQVASNLNISPRTLQRRLKAEGYTYKTLIDELRKQFAYDYLKDQNLSIKEIAYLLDYSEASAFVRSFKRWEGISPALWRTRV